MKGTIETYISDEINVEVEYEYWGGGSSYDYDSPADESGFEIQQINLRIGKTICNLVVECEDLSDALNWEKINEAIEKKLTNY